MAEDDSQLLGQDEIEDLLRQAQAASKPKQEQVTPPASGESVPGADPAHASDSTASAAPMADPQASSTVSNSAAGAAISKDTGASSSSMTNSGSGVATLSKSSAAQGDSGSPGSTAQTNQPANHDLEDAVNGMSNAATPDGTSRTGDDLDLLLRHTEEAIASVDSPNHSQLDGLRTFELSDLTGTPPSEERTTLELLKDVELDLKIELGRTQMYLEEVLKLRKGSVVPLDKLAGDPVDIYVNGRLVARGEVLVLNENFCVRVAELISGIETNGR